MLLFSISTFMSLTQALSTLRKVWVARLTAMLIASSKLSSEMALNSVTRATDINTPFFVFPYLKCFYPCIGSVNAKGLCTKTYLVCLLLVALQALHHKSVLHKNLQF